MITRQPRYRVDIAVDCSTQGAFVGNRVTNISRGGVFIETCLPIDSQVDLQFTLPDWEVSIGAQGRVIWNYDMQQRSVHLVRGSGIQFTRMSAEHRALLESYLSRLAGAEPERPRTASTPSS